MHEYPQVEIHGKENCGATTSTSVISFLSLFQVMLLTTEYKQQNYNIGIFVLLDSWFQSALQMLHTILYIFFVNIIVSTIVLIFHIKNSEFIGEKKKNRANHKLIPSIPQKSLCTLISFTQLLFELQCKRKVLSHRKALLKTTGLMWQCHRVS